MAVRFLRGVAFGAVFANHVAAARSAGRRRITAGAAAFEESSRFIVRFNANWLSNASYRPARTSDTVAPVGSRGNVGVTSLALALYVAESAMPCAFGIRLDATY